MQRKGSRKGRVHAKLAKGREEQRGSRKAPKGRKERNGRKYARDYKKLLSLCRSRLFTALCGRNRLHAKRFHAEDAKGEG